MIHYTREGEYLRLGLNFRFTGGLHLIWCWYNLATREITTRRLRLLVHPRPRVVVSKNTHNVIENYLRLNDLAVVSVETLADLRAIEQATWRRTSSNAWIRPGGME